MMSAWPMRSPNQNGVVTAARSFSSTSSTPPIWAWQRSTHSLQLLLAQHPLVDQADRLVGEPAAQRADLQAHAGAPAPLSAIIALSGPTSSSR